MDSSERVLPEEEESMMWWELHLGAAMCCASLLWDKPTAWLIWFCFAGNLYALYHEFIKYRRFNGSR